MASEIVMSCVVCGDYVHVDCDVEAVACPGCLAEAEANLAEERGRCSCCREVLDARGHCPGCLAEAEDDLTSGVPASVIPPQICPECGADYEIYPGCVCELPC
jgi:hypothetical protein